MEPLLQVCGTACAVHVGSDAQGALAPQGATCSACRCSLGLGVQVGNEFAVSMVPEGQDRVVMKSLARSFAPDEDRLASLDITEGPLTGAAVLKVRAGHKAAVDALPLGEPTVRVAACWCAQDANAFLECKVVSRMEAGDHFIVYASVLGGDVINDKPTAVHHRKVANHY